MSDSETVESTSGAGPTDDTGARSKKRLPLGLDLGTLESCILSKLSKPGPLMIQGLGVKRGYRSDWTLAP